MVFRFAQLELNLRMIRARSPLFGLSFFLAVVLGIGAAWVAFTPSNPVGAMESWVQTPKLGEFRFVGWLLSLLGFSALSAVAVIELLILKGWEPNWLRRFVPGCLVVDIYRHGSDPEGHLRLEVQSPSEWANWYILDQAETNLCKVGDTIHLWAIGKHVAHVAVVEPSMVVYPPQTRIAGWARNKEQKQDGCAWMFMLIAPLLGGGLVGKGLEHILFAEIRYSGGGRRRRYVPPRVATGLEAQLIGGLMVTLGVVLAGWVFYKWMSGWEDEEIQELWQESYSSRRSWWS
jgi:hypothetical protein